MKFCRSNDPWSFADPKIPMLYCESVCSELIAALCSGAEHDGNRVNAIHACALYQHHISMLVFHQSNRVSAIKRMLFYYRHIVIFVFFHVSACSLLLPRLLLSLLRCVWEWRRYVMQYSRPWGWSEFLFHTMHTSEEAFRRSAAALRKSLNASSGIWGHSSYIH